MTSSTTSLWSGLEKLEKSRDAFHYELAKAGLLLTESRRACEQRGCSCDLTAIPIDDDTLVPLASLIISEKAVANEMYVGNRCNYFESGENLFSENEELPSKEISEGNSSSAFCPSFLLCQENGYAQRKKKGENATLVVEKQKHQYNGESASCISPSSSLNGRKGEKNDPEDASKNKDPILYVCNPPFSTLIACRDQYRRALAALVDAANAQIQLLHTIPAS